MSKKTIAFLFLLILSPIVIYFLWPTDEVRIKKLIKNSISAIEKEEPDRVMSAISFNYQDDYGLSYLLLKKLLVEQFSRLSGIEVEYENLTIRINKENADARLDIRVIASLGNDRGYFLGDIKEPAHIELDLEKGPMKRWLIIRASGFR